MLVDQMVVQNKFVFVGEHGCIYQNKNRILINFLITSVVYLFLSYM
jgi:hypothetical protein